MTGRDQTIREFLSQADSSLAGELLLEFLEGHLGDEGVFACPGLTLQEGGVVYPHAPASTFSHVSCERGPADLPGAFLRLSDAGGRIILVELAAGQRPDLAKSRAALDLLGIECVEVDLREHLDEPLETIDHLLSHEAPRRWITHSQNEAARQRLAELVAERRAMLPVPARPTDDLGEEIRIDRRRTVCETIDLVQEFAIEMKGSQAIYVEPKTNLSSDSESVIFWETTPSHVFDCHPRSWQIEVIRALDGSARALDPVEISKTPAIRALYSDRTFGEIDAAVHMTLGFLGIAHLCPSGLIADYIKDRRPAGVFRYVELQAGMQYFALGPAAENVAGKIRITPPVVEEPIIVPEIIQQAADPSPAPDLDGPAQMGLDF